MSTSTMLEFSTPQALRKRTKTLQLPSEFEGLGSELPNPMSSVDDVPEADAPAVLATTLPKPRRRRSSASTQSSRKTKAHRSSPAETAADAQWTDIPLAVALIPPLGSFLTGGDFLRDFLLFILLFFYLHQLIKLPWELYLASRPRRRRATQTEVTTDEQRLQDLAASELRTAEFCYLALAVFAPLLGAAMLRCVGTFLMGRDYISWFSTGIFVLVTGVRPWRHLGKRLRGRTEELQEAVHGTTRADDLEERVKQLEKELTALRETSATRDEMAVLDESVDELYAAVKRTSRLAEGGRYAMEARVKTLERSVEGVRVTPTVWTLAAPRSLLDWMRPQAVSPRAASPRSTPRAGYRPRLAPVREEDSDGGSAQPQEHYSLSFAWVEMALIPLKIGKRLVWLIVEFLSRRLL